MAYNPNVPVKRLPPLYALLAVALAVLYGIVWLSMPTTTQLAPARRVVVLLIPGLTPSDLNDARSFPVLTALATRHPIALLRTLPKERFTTACQRIARVVSASQARLQSAHVANYYIGGEEALPFAGEAYQTLPTSDWQASDPDTATGTRTDVEAFTHAILTVCHPQTPTPPMLLLASYDDLYRAKQYAPLTLPEVAQAQHNHALKHLDAILATLTGTKGLDTDTALFVLTPTTGDTQRLAPLLYWRRKGDNAQILQEQHPGSEPGIVSLKAVFSTIADRLTASNFILPSTEGVQAVPGSSSELIERAELFSARQKNRRYLPLFLLALLLIASTTVWLVRQGRERLLRATVGAIVLAPLLLYVAGIAPLNTTVTGSGYVLALLGSVVAFGLIYLIPAKKAPALLLDLCLLTVMVLLADRGAGLWLASGSPLAERTIGRWFSPLEGMVVGATLLCVQAILPPSWQGRRWLVPAVWAVAGTLLFVFGGIATSGLCLLYAIGLMLDGNIFGSGTRRS